MVKASSTPARVWRPTAFSSGVRVVVGVAMIGFTTRNLVLGQDDLPMGQVLATALLWLAAASLITIALREQAVTDGKGLEVRNAFRTKRFQWSEIQGVEPHTKLAVTIIALRSGRRMAVRAIRREDAGDFVAVVSASTTKEPRTPRP